MNKLVRHLTIPFLAFALFGFQSANAQNQADFVFLIDATDSMTSEIGGVKNGFSSFVTGLDTAAIDARFSIILFGGGPELVLDFTDDAAAVSAAFNLISASGAVTGFQNNHNTNPEGGLEAIRMVLGEANFNTLVTNNLDAYSGDGTLNYRADARKNIILVTDEDSDRPFYAANQFSGQDDNEPPIDGEASDPGWDGWQEEIDATAQAVISNYAFLNMLINTDDAPTRFQYGDYAYDYADADLLNFDPDATLEGLTTGNEVSDDSLQAQVLEEGLIARTFNLAGANDANFVNNFFAAKIEETIEYPVIEDPIEYPADVPEPAAIMLLLLGIGGLGYTRKRKALRAVRAA